MPVRHALSLGFALCAPFATSAAKPVRATAADLHSDALWPTTLSCQVLSNDAAASGPWRTMLATNTGPRAGRRQGHLGARPIVEDESGRLRSARKARVPSGGAKLAQASHWTRDDCHFVTRITRATGLGEIEGVILEAHNAGGLRRNWRRLPGSPFTSAAGQASVANASNVGPPTSELSDMQA